MTLKFGTDGVRGVANQELTPELALNLGRAAARVLGGVAAGMAYPTTLSLITALWSGAGRTKAIALWSAIGGALSALGPMVSGALLAVPSEADDRRPDRRGVRRPVRCHHRDGVGVRGVAGRAG